ncbi:MAG: DUF86 domain-containing protein [Deltaproteobacteria bacterium]|nr:DUF86 domain-containing protein [Deltaproteobacteria bacterium]
MKTETKARLIKHLSFLEVELNDRVLVNDLSWDEYNTDRVKRRHVERWVENVVNSSIDIARIVLTTENLPVPDTYKEVVVSLSLVTVFDRETCERMARHVRLRNILTHEYLDIRWASIRRFIDEADQLYARLVADTKAYLAANE